MPVTVSEAAWYAVTDGTRADYTTEKCKEKPMIWDEIKED